MEWILIFALSQGGVDHIEFGKHGENSRNKAACLHAAEAIKQRVGASHIALLVCVPKGSILPGYPKD